MKMLIKLLVVCCFYSSCVLPIKKCFDFDRELLSRRIDELRELNSMVFVDRDFIEAIDAAPCVVIRDENGDECCLSDQEKMVFLESKKNELWACCLHPRR